MNPEELHDSTLVDMTVQWGRTVSLVARFRTWIPAEATLTFKDVRQFTFANERPWGPSVSVNAVRSSQLSPELSRIEIELQSGDTIVIEGCGVEWH